MAEIIHDDGTGAKPTNQPATKQTEIKFEDTDREDGLLTPPGDEPDEQEEQQTETPPETGGDDDEGGREPRRGSRFQQRIDQLVRKTKEYEEQLEAGSAFTRGLVQKLREYEAGTVSANAELLTTEEERLKAEQLRAREEMQAAFNSGDAIKMVEASEKIAEIAVSLKQVAAAKHQAEQAREVVSRRKPEEEPYAVREVRERSATEPKPKKKISEHALSWAKRNDWYGKDSLMSQSAQIIDQDLMREGMNPDTPEYYEELDNRLKDYFPQKLGGKKAAPRYSGGVVAGVSRTSGNGSSRTVRLSPSERAMADRLGVSYDEYARFVVRERE